MNISANQEVADFFSSHVKTAMSSADFNLNKMVDAMHRFKCKWWIQKVSSVRLIPVYDTPFAFAHSCLFFQIAAVIRHRFLLMCRVMSWSLTTPSYFNVPWFVADGAGLLLSTDPHRSMAGDNFRFSHSESEPCAGGPQQNSGAEGLVVQPMLYVSHRGQHCYTLPVDTQLVSGFGMSDGLVTGRGKMSFYRVYV